MHATEHVVGAVSVSMNAIKAVMPTENYNANFNIYYMYFFSDVFPNLIRFS